MSIKHKVKSLFMTLALLAGFGFGYLSISVVTAERADALLCFSGNSCVSDSDSVASQLVKEQVAINDADLGLALIAMTVEYMEPLSLLFTEIVEKRIKMSTAKIKQGLQTFWWYNERPAMQATTEQLSVAQTAQTSDLIKFHDAQEMTRTQQDIQEDEVDQGRKAKGTENGCVTATITSGMTAGYAIRRAYGAHAPVETRVSGSSLQPNGVKIIDRSSNSTSAGGSAGGSGQDMAARFANYSEKYCDPTANGGHAGCTTSTTNANRDLDVQGEIFNKANVNVKDPATQAATGDLITNIAEPFIMDPVPGDVLDTTDGKMLMMGRESYRAKRQVIYDALYQAVARRAPAAKNMRGFIDEIDEAIGFDPSMMNSSTNPSHMEMMEALAVKRFRSGKYSLSQVDEPESNSKELVIQQATLALQLNDLLDLTDRYALIVAARAGGEVSKMKPMTSQADKGNVK